MIGITCRLRERYIYIIYYILSIRPSPALRTFNRNRLVGTRLIPYLALFSVAFGLFNLSMSGLAAGMEHEEIDRSEQQKERDAFVNTVVLNLISQTGPLVGGAALFVIQFLRKQGVAISADAEEYFVNTAKSFVANQSRSLYKTIRDKPEFRDALLQGRIPPGLGEIALENVKKELRKELESQEFTDTTRKMLDDNLGPLIERYLTENKKELADRGRKLLIDLVPTAVGAALLAFNTPEEARKKKDPLVKEALEAVAKSLDFQEILIPQADIEMMVKSELNKKIGLSEAGVR